MGYLYFELLNRITKTATNFTKLVSFEAISSLKKNVDIKEKIRQYQNKSFKDEFVFLVRAYNEAQMIGQVIDDIIKAGYHKIVVVSDGSIDETDSIVLAKREYYSDSLIFLLNHQVNRGGGAANKTGFEFLKRYGEYLAPWVVTFDADGQMDVADMLSFESEIKNAPKPLDILLWSRYVKGWSAQNIPTLRKIIHVWSKWVTYFFSRIRVSDPHNGYRVISLQTVKKMNIVSDNMTYASELLDEISRLHLKYVEVPVNIIYTDYSLSKGQKNANALKILLEMIYTKFFYK